MLVDFSILECEFETIFVDLPRNDDSVLVGCKRAASRTKYYLTTAGMLALIRPCGIVISMRDVYL